jgi:Uri superfamily endonuclease
MPERRAFRTHAEALPGGYALELHLPLGGLPGSPLVIGRLGAFEFPAGVYLYLGSARGPGGLRARLDRHLRPAAEIRPHWNIDHLRPFTLLAAAAYLYDADGAPADLECCWSRALLELPGAAVPAAGFGSADCRSGCPAHLLAFPSGPFSAGFLSCGGAQILARSVGAASVHLDLIKAPVPASRAHSL